MTELKIGFLKTLFIGNLLCSYVSDEFDSDYFAIGVLIISLGLMIIGYFSKEDKNEMGKM